MRISTKLTIGLAFTCVVILGAYGIAQLRQEERDLRLTARHDFRLLGAALQAGLQHSLRDGHPEDVRGIVESVELRDSAIQLLVFDRDGHVLANTPGSGRSVSLVASDMNAVMHSGRPADRFEGPDGLTRLIGAFPLLDDAGTYLGGAALVLPLDGLRRDLNAEMTATTLSIITALAGIVGVGWVLAVVFVRRPLASLREAMKRVEAGNWVTRVQSDRADEVGSVLAEFNAMVAELEQTRAKFLEAAEARELLEAGLQRLDKLVSLGQLSASIAHEIGSPLQILNGRARALAVRADLPPDVRRTAQILEEQSDRIARIIEQLLNVARRKASNVTAIDFAAAVTTIADLMEPESRRVGVRFTRQVQPSLPPAIADGDQVQQVAMNLLSNAFRATPRGGAVSLSVSAGSFERDGGVRIGSVTLSVEDSGPGIPDDIATRMFEPFFTTWASRGGSGLGLAVVKAIVDDHRGAIVRVPVSGGGTRFDVHFPAAGSGGISAVA